MPENPFSKGRTSVARIPDDWYILSNSSSLGKVPARVTLYGIPLVLFRDAQGKASALLDRCPHRNAPLSLGSIKGDALECAYHGWRFRSSGMCESIPGIATTAMQDRHKVPSFPVQERDGFVWVYGEADAEPKGAPFAFPHLSDRRYATIRATLSAKGSLHAVAENALDVPHTAYLHSGLFRKPGRKSRAINVTTSRWHDRVEAEYHGESRPSGLAGMLLSPGGGTVSHVDRFLLPGIVQVEYRLAESSHLCITAVLTPSEEFVTHINAVMSFRTPLPDSFLALILKPIVLKIFRQDAAILEAQSRTINAFGGEQFQSTESDILGPQILRLLRQAEQGDRTVLTKPVVTSLQLHL